MLTVHFAFQVYYVIAQYSIPQRILKAIKNPRYPKRPSDKTIYCTNVCKGAFTHTHTNGGISTVSFRVFKRKHPVCQAPRGSQKNVGCLYNFRSAVISFHRLFNVVCCHRSAVGVKQGGPPGGVDPDLPRLPSPPPPRATQP